MAIAVKRPISYLGRRGLTSNDIRKTGEPVGDRSNCSVDKKSTDARKEIAGMETSPNVFRDYDQTALDRQLNLRARWPEHADFFARWSRESAALCQRLTCHLNVPYGDTALQKLDIFPSATPRTPILVFIHGGYWQGRDKEEFNFLAAPFVAAGIAFASMNYDLAPQVSVEEMVRQTRRALCWLYRNADDYGIDRQRIFVCGHSAGGHLATMAALTDWSLESADLPPRLLSGAASISGLYELEAVRLSYHNEVLNLDADMARRISPRFATPNWAAPLFCAVGLEETAEFLRQQQDFAVTWRAAGHKVETVELPGHTHFTILDAMADTTDSLCAALRERVLSDPIEPV